MLGQRDGRFGEFMSFWANKKVLVTGHTGFKGGWLAKTLKVLGAEVYGISLAELDQTSFFNLCSVANVLSEDARVDITDTDNFQQKVKDIGPDIVFHLAAQPIVGLSYEDPTGTFKTNVMGVVNLFEALRNVENCQAIVNVTTDKVYKNENWFWPYREIDELGGNDPYSASKACAELVTHAYFKSFMEGRGIGTARAGNVIGGGDFSRYRLVPDIVKSLLNEYELVIYNPDHVRPWQHVLDPVFGYIRLAELLYREPELYSGNYNFSGDSSNMKSVADIVEVFKLHYHNLRIRSQSEGRQFKEQSVLLLDSMKAKKHLQWEGLFDFSSAINSTIAWYDVFLQNGELIKYTDMQIEHYLEKQQ